MLSELSMLGALSSPDAQLLFLISIATVILVALFACGAFAVLLHRGYRRRLAQQKLAAMGTTTARILHQIKNPVQTLLLQSELLEEFEREDRPELRREAVEAVAIEANRLALMLSELSRWASGEARTVSLTPAPLHELVADVGRDQERAAEARGARFELRINQPAYADVDPYYLRQALDNLIRNAWDAVQGQSEPRVRIELERRGSRAELRVVDNGPGIPPERIKRIFEPFYSSKGTGMGLGLPICREIVESHGGAIQVRSVPGEGTTVIVLLPLNSANFNGRDALIALGSPASLAL